MKSHLKSIAAPKSWKFARKKNTFLTRPHPGAHSIGESVSLNFVLKELLHLVKTTKEARYILNKKEVLVDGKRRKNVKFPVGLMDIISIPETNANYLMLLNETGKLRLKEISKKDADTKLCWIKNKRAAKDNILLGLNDGRNITLKGENKEYKLKDSIMIKLPSQEIVKHLPFKENSLAYVVKGKHIGSVGPIQKMIGSKVFITCEGQTIETVKDKVFIIGDKTPAIQL